MMLVKISFKKIILMIIVVITITTMAEKIGENDDYLRQHKLKKQK